MFDYFRYLDMPYCWGWLDFPAPYMPRIAQPRCNQQNRIAETAQFAVDLANDAGELQAAR